MPYTIYHMKALLSEDLVWRGLIKDKTFASSAWLDEPKTFYHGVDVSSDSLTIGNLAALILAKRLIDSGWKAVLLVGGATSLIGDPGGKTAERDLKPREEISRNDEAIKKQVGKLFAGVPFIPADNYDWFKDIKYLDFLRDVGKHYSMTELMQRDFVRERMGEEGSGISYAEFSYSLVQGYDYWQLYKMHKVVLQIGGSDQWANMLSGASLIRKKEGVEVHALSMPLVVDKGTGRKFGKSEAGAVWLDPAKTSVYQFYQFWFNVDDEDAEDYLKKFTLLDKNMILTVLSKFEHNKGERLAQKTLAYEVTNLVHGEARAMSVKKISEVLFDERAFSELTAEERNVLKQELPVLVIPQSYNLASVVCDVGLASSKSEVTRLIASNAISINGSRVPMAPEPGAFFELGDNLLKVGKNSFAVIERKKDADFYAKK